MDFDGAAVGLAAVAAFAGGGGAGEHAVLGGEPALAFAHEPGWNALFDDGGAEDAGLAEGDEDGAAGVLGEVALEGDGAEVGGAAVVVAYHAWFQFKGIGYRQPSFGGSQG